MATVNVNKMICVYHGNDEGCVRGGGGGGGEGITAPYQTGNLC